MCSRNKWRSYTAEKIFDGVNGHEVRSAGTENNARIKVTDGHIGWADMIFVMEKKHLRRIQEKFGDKLGNKEVNILDISDDYTFMDEQLVEILKCRVSEYIDILVVMSKARFQIVVRQFTQYHMLKVIYNIVHSQHALAW